MRTPGAAMLAVALLATPAQAQQQVALSSAVYVERDARSGGTLVTRADRLESGDTVVMKVDWRAPAGSTASAFTVATPIPASLAFQKSGAPNLQVSVDGGRSWGRLGVMRVREGGRTRLVAPEDATNIRWRVPASKARSGSGSITYSALVR